MNANPVRKPRVLNREPLLTLTRKVVEQRGCDYKVSCEPSDVPLEVERLLSGCGRDLERGVCTIKPNRQPCVT